VQKYPSRPILLIFEVYMHICLQFLGTLPPDPHRGSAAESRWGVPPSRPPACPPSISKFLARPLIHIMLNECVGSTAMTERKTELGRAKQGLIFGSCVLLLLLFNYYYNYYFLFFYIKFF